MGIGIEIADGKIKHNDSKARRISLEGENKVFSRFQFYQVSNIEHLQSSIFQLAGRSRNELRTTHQAGIQFLS